MAGALSLAVCASISRRDVPAVLTNPTAESRAALARAVSGALHGAPVTIADDALTRDSTLIIERARPRTPDGVPLSGRETGRPERFRLVKDGSRCVLVHERTGKRWTLKAATCSASPLAPPSRIPLRGAQTPDMGGSPASWMARRVSVKTRRAEPVTKSTISDKSA